MKITKIGIDLEGREKANKDYDVYLHYGSIYRTIVECYVCPKCEAERQTLPYLGEHYL